MASDPRTRLCWVTEQALATITDAARTAHPDEAGGVLVGVYADNGFPWVTRAIAVSGVATTNSYQLPEGARPQVVRAARLEDARVGYLGDWHSHPANVGPSGTDRATMRRLAADPEAGCPHPLLLIARHRTGTYVVDAHRMGRVRMRRLTVVETGPLGPAGESPNPSGRPIP